MRAEPGKERTNNYTNTVHRDNTSFWILEVNQVPIASGLNMDIPSPRLVPSVKRSMHACIPLIPVLRDRVMLHEDRRKNRRIKGTQGRRSVPILNVKVVTKLWKRRSEREREIYIFLWLQVRITGPRHHLTSSLRATRRGTTRLTSIYNRFQVWSLGCAARSSMWFVMFYPPCGWCFAGWYRSGRVIAGFTGRSGEKER
jgi:hypothetical protein